jgi:hypothetical protein
MLLTTMVKQKTNAKSCLVSFNDLRKIHSAALQHKIRVKTKKIEETGIKFIVKREPRRTNSTLGKNKLNKMTQEKASNHPRQEGGLGFSLPSTVSIAGASDIRPPVKRNNFRKSDFMHHSAKRLWNDKKKGKTPAGGESEWMKR